MENPYSILKRVFGYDSFRPGQKEIVDAILAGQDVLAVMPTGAGKSICYQVPALAMDGITLVVSPLISLMQDQVRALVAAGVPAAYLNNSLTDNQKALMLSRAREGRYKIIYVAPERLQMQGFLRFAEEQPIGMVTVDEAHCISQWGHDFRPSYLQIRDFVRQLPRRPVVSAFTATATARVREDIQDKLGLDRPFRLTTGFDRPNLRFETMRVMSSEKPRALVDFMLEEGDAPGIVYCSTIRQVGEGGAEKEPGGFPLRPDPGDGGYQCLRHGDRQAQRPVCPPLQHAQGHRELLPGGGPGRPGRGPRPVCAVLCPQRCADRPVPHRPGGGVQHPAR